MLTCSQVRYEVRETSIGKGLFLLEPVAKGALIWRYVLTIMAIAITNYHRHRHHQLPSPSPTTIDIDIAIGITIRYREGENILCFRNEAETRKHLDSMASDADRFNLILLFIVH